MKNPLLFGAAKAAKEQAVAAGSAKKPLLQGSAAMMLKGMGIDPDQIGAMAEQIVETLVSCDARFARIEAQNAEILKRLDAQAVVIGLNADVAKAVADEASGQS